MSKQIERYTGPAMILHWLVALMLVGNVCLGLLTDSFGKENTRFIIGVHESMGVSILGFMLMRILWRAKHRPPALPASFKPWERRASFAVHGLLYLTALGLATSGLINDSSWNLASQIKWQWFGLFEWPRISWIMNMDPQMRKILHVGFGKVHELLAWGLYLLVFVHIGGALKHQFLDGEPEIERMWPAR